MKSYHDCEYLEMLVDIKDFGVQKGDRTGTGTRSLFGYELRFDLSDGTIPLLTTKKMFSRGIIRELLWFIRSDVNIKPLNHDGVRIWDSWSNDEGYIGTMYGKYWRSFPPPTRYLPIQKRKIYDSTTSDFVFNSVDVVEDEFTGELHTNKSGFEYEILGIDGKGNNGKTYTVRFIDSGWIKTGIERRSVRAGKFSDNSIPSVYGVGIFGNYSGKKESAENKSLRRTWENMISRCYNQNDKRYSTHGGNGVFVCNRWKVLSNFIEDVKRLPNWFEKRNHLNSYVLDKDFFGDSKLYHPESCVWLLQEENKKLRSDAIAYQISSDNDILFFPSEKSCANFLNISQTKLKSLIGKKYGVYNIKLFEDESFVVRPAIHSDQLNNVINEIRNNPNSRRLVVTAWHPGFLPDESLSPNKNVDIGRQCLASCHHEFQFWVAEGKLCLKLTQRSADSFLGVPFNIAQYSMLLHMVASITGLQAGEFIWSGGDVHIYNNHMDAIEEQLSHEPVESPKFWVNPLIKEIDDFTFDDLKVVDYNCPYERISAPVAV